MSKTRIVWIFDHFDRTARKILADDARVAAEKYVKAFAGVKEFREEGAEICVLDRPSVRDLFDVSEEVASGADPEVAKLEVLSQMHQEATSFVASYEGEWVLE